MKISLVVPVFNEEDTIPLFYQAVRNFKPLAQYEIEIIFINDGSQDKTSYVAGMLLVTDPLVTLVNFSRNFGKEAALFAGLEYATGDAVIPIDVDLQDPLDVIPMLIKKWESGADVVLAKRTERHTDGYFKRRSAEMFYKLHNKISHPKIEENVGDFRLMSRKVVKEITRLPERNLFMKGILSWVGFRTEIVEYSRAERIAGVSKFNGWKLWNLALEGITSFSTFPLRIWTYLGFWVSGFAFIYSVWMVLDKIIWGNPVPGYPSLMTAILFLGGIQLIGIGMLGEYIGRIYLESKNRPRYIIESIEKGEEVK
ncbi:glycosyltransferase family 2 protein [Candidatus Fukatsuia endosymbiont of Tuberolachnus salignus]|uniref:glycosyltransferase family 2 protein n=1 Tax=Candidatus Fukatsuia endosymbiont of Tuberolachnus salignus TaxID=3077957 RepID=UPI00313EEB9D